MGWPEVSPADILRVGRGYVGTPFHKDGRVKGVGVDCIGLVVCVFRDLGVDLSAIDCHRHTQGDMCEILKEGLSQFCDPVTRIDNGDILIVRSKGVFNHCGLVFPLIGTWIHAVDSRVHNKVIEQPITDKWLERVCAAYRYKGAAVYGGSS